MSDPDSITVQLVSVSKDLTGRVFDSSLNHYLHAVRNLVNV